MRIILDRVDHPNFCFRILPVTSKGTVRKRWPDGSKCTESVFIQTDWDYPGTANSFGWNIASVKPADEPDEDDVATFISAAFDWLCENDGAIAEDPGYF